MSHNSESKNEEISLSELTQKIKGTCTFLLTKWKLVVIGSLIGCSTGFLYAWIMPVKYISRLTFVLEESKGGTGGLASLAGQFGIDLGGAAGGSVFSGDNILLFLKSESLIRETLFTPFSEDKIETLADRYAEVNGWKKDWANDEKIGLINFSKYSLISLPRKEDSLLQELTDEIFNKDLFVIKPDKKASFIEVKSSMADEYLSKLFSERLVKIATQRYVQSKTKIKFLNVQKLQNKADSLVSVLNNRTYSAASSQQQLVDVNPALRTAPIIAEISSRDKLIASTLYGEVVKNLELSKTLLSQETPVIETVDQSTLPLETEKLGKLKSLVVGGLLSCIFIVCFLLIRRWLQTRF